MHRIEITRTPLPQNLANVGVGPREYITMDANELRANAAHLLAFAEQLEPKLPTIEDIKRARVELTSVIRFGQKSTDAGDMDAIRRALVLIGGELP